ncbi:MAG: DUF5684 domain-containing protein [Gemmatimonadota bacterium]|nr:DUF5684 domain-containing protein [Gemmatimonadota bacterium]
MILPALHIAAAAIQAPLSNTTSFGIIACEIAFAVLIIASMWIAFAKAGEPGWAAIVPFYNIYVMCRIAGKPGWWLLLMLIPLVNLVVIIVVCVGIANHFGRGAGFGVGLALLGFIFWPILAFSDSQYNPVAA